MTGLIGWWPLHEDSGNKAYDLSGNNNHGTLNGGITQGVAGKGGLTSYSFDGNDDYVQLSSSIDFGSNQDFTIVLWFKQSSINGDILYKQEGSSAYQGYFIRPLNGTINFEIRDSGGSQFNAALENKYDDDQWHLLVAGRKGSDIFLNIDNGREEKIVSATSGDLTNSSPLYFGRDRSGTDYWNGVMADARFYDRALSAQEVQELYDWGNGDYARPLNNENSSSAVSRWALDGDVTDSWSSNDGTDNTSAGYTNGVRGQAKAFDGTDDYITVGNLGSIYSSGFSFSVWFRTNTDHNGIFVSADDESGGTRITQFKKKSGGQLEFNFIGSTLVDTGPQPNDEWMHGVAVYRNNGAAEIYLNGILEAEGSSGINSGDPQVVLGMQEDGNGVNSLNGDLDDVRIYDKALSPEEIFDLYRWGTRGRDMRKFTVNSR